MLGNDAPEWYKAISNYGPTKKDQMHLKASQWLFVLSLKFISENRNEKKKVPNHTAILLPSSRGRQAINFLNALRSVDLMTCIWTTLVTKTQRPWQLAEKENRTNFKFIRIYFNSPKPKDARKSSEEIGGGRFGSRDTQGSETCLCSLSGVYI